MKEVDINRPLPEQKNYDNQYGRFWIKPVLQINNKHYLLCSQWFERYQEQLDKWISNVHLPVDSMTNREKKDSDTLLASPDDYRFTKESYIKDVDPLQKRLSENLGTRAHIEYLKMLDGDARRHKARCAEYDKKKDICMCVKSPYFIMHCGGSSHCEYYAEAKVFSGHEELFEKNKKIVYVVRKEILKQRECPTCGEKIKSHVLMVSFRKNGNIIRNQLNIFLCGQCNKNFMDDASYKTYTTNKKIEDISVDFVQEEKQE